jgi:peptidoglycan-associated lipoprotein
MKMLHFSSLVLVALVVSFSSVGCKKAPAKPITSIPGGAGTTTPFASGEPMPDSGSIVPGGTNGSTTPIGKDGLIEGSRPAPGEYTDDPETFRGQTVYFEYDRANIKSGEMSKIESIATFLKNETQTKVRVEGHCDERGTPGYNLSLGERRALSIREYLVARGISPDRVATVSYGEERPASPGHDESAWSKNRRGEFIVLRPK